MWRMDLGPAPGRKRRQAYLQQSVSGLPRHGGVRPGLFGQRFAEQPEKKTEGMRVEFTEIGKPDGLTGREPPARGFDL